MEHFGTEVAEVKEAELKVAHQLIDALADKFEPERSMTLTRRTFAN